MQLLLYAFVILLMQHTIKQNASIILIIFSSVFKHLGSFLLSHCFYCVLFFVCSFCSLCSSLRSFFSLSSIYSPKILNKIKHLDLNQEHTIDGYTLVNEHSVLESTHYRSYILKHSAYTVEAHSSRGGKHPIESMGNTQ